MKTPPRVQKTSRKRKTEPRGAGHRALTLVTSVLVAILVIVSVTLVLRRVVPHFAEQYAQANRIDLRYLPPDAEFLVVMRPARIWNSSLLQAYRAHPEYVPRLSPLWRIAGVRPADIDSLTFAASHALPRAGTTGDGPDLRQFVAVFRSPRAIPAPNSISGFMRVELVSGETEHWRITPDSEAPRPVLAAWRPNEETLVLGREELVQRAIQAGDVLERRIELDFVDPHRDILIVLAPADPLGLQRASAGPIASVEPLDALFSTYADHVASAALGVRFEPEVELQLLCQCRDETAAAAVAIGTEAATTGVLRSIPPGETAGWRRLRHLLRQTVTSARTVRTGTVVEVSAAVPDTAESVLRDRSLGRVHALLFEPLDRAFAKFPSPHLLAGFELSQRDTGGDEQHTPASGAPNE